MGGRGASGQMGGGFTSAASSSGGSGNSERIHASRLNTQGRFASVEGAEKIFADNYKNADIEYGASVDEQGFVHRAVRGDQTSVAISPAGENHTLLHNHPSGGNFSSADIEVFATARNARSLKAIGGDTTYSLTKGRNFDGAGLNKAMKRAKWPTNLSYDEGSAWWLKRNAKKFGYTYSSYKTLS